LHRFVETLTVGIQWIWVISDKSQFENYLEPVVIAKLLNETLLVCGLCLVMSNCLDNLLSPDETRIDVITDATFLDFMDE